MRAPNCALLLRGDVAFEHQLVRKAQGGGKFRRQGEVRLPQKVNGAAEQKALAGLVAAGDHKRLVAAKAQGGRLIQQRVSIPTKNRLMVNGAPLRCHWRRRGFLDSHQAANGPKFVLIPQAVFV